MGDANVAVQVRDAVKSYTAGTMILNHLNMTVPRGSIYGLLGASGCGKSTSLNAIVGLQKLDSGSIHVFGRPVPGYGIPGKRLGYMPQDIALYPYFTIHEIILYFGRIYGMKKSDILKREEFLTKFLQLPNSSKCISYLSGGQQRRVSLAVAMVASPELVILDEPTVGLDPLLRKSIWDYLCQMVKNGRTTVIITTHYIEEVRQSQTIGFMRNGRLLAEDSPSNLLTKFNAVLLEDIVLQLCKKDHMQNIAKAEKMQNVTTNNADSKSDFYDKEIQKLSIDEYKPAKPNFQNEASLSNYFQTKNNDMPVAESNHDGCIVISVNNIKNENQKLDVFTQEQMVVGNKEKFNKVFSVLRGPSQKIFALSARNCIFFMRNLWYFFILVIYPAIQTALVASTLGGDPRNMSIAVVNNELINWKDSCPNVAAHTCDTKPYSCRFLNKLQTDQVSLIPFATKKDAVKAINAGEHYGVLTIPANYTQHLIDRTLAGNFATNDTLDGTTIHANLDYSNYIASLLLTRQLYGSLENYAMELGKDCGRSPREFEFPFGFTPVYGRLDANYTEFVVPGALVIILFLVPLGTSGLEFVGDKRQGTMDRSRAAGITTLELMISFFITDGLVIVIQIVLSTAIIVYGYEFKMEGSYILYGILCFITGLCGQSWGFVLGILCPNEWTLLLTGFSLQLFMLTQAGIIWPLDGIPFFVKNLSYCMPVTASLQSMRSIISRGVGLESASVWPGFVILSIWIILAWNFAIIKYKTLRK